MSKIFLKSKKNDHPNLIIGVEENGHAVSAANQMTPSTSEPMVAMSPNDNAMSNIQRQEIEKNEIGPDASSSLPGFCESNPEFPDFYCFMTHLKRNVDENLYNNAHHFTRIASLYPDDTQRMEDAFFRYGLGLNVLETSFQFLGTGEGWATGLGIGTGIGLKTYDFFNNGELLLDYQIELSDGVNLDLNFDLNVNPDDLSDVREVRTGIGISGHF